MTTSRSCGAAGIDRGLRSDVLSTGAQRVRRGIEAKPILVPAAGLVRAGRAQQDSASTRTLVAPFHRRKRMREWALARGS